MESLNFPKGMKLKSKAVPKHRKQLRKIANLLRYVEMCVVLVLISRLSLIQLPLALKNSSDYLRGFTVSPRLVFLVGNIIIITLFAQSGHFSTSSSATTNAASESHLYLEFLHNSSTVLYQKNNSTIDIIKGRKNKIIKEAEKQISSTKGEDNNSRMKKDYRRCQSEMMLVLKDDDEKPGRVLQRCESHNSNSNSSLSLNLSSYPEDGMSNDEFRRTVEAFIARQQRLRLHELQTFNSQEELS